MNKMTSTNLDHWGGRLLAVISLVVVAFAGCRTKEADSREEVSATHESHVIAQGQILPGKGFLRLAAAPGDVVEQVLVNVGDEVVAGQTLLVMQSEAVRNLQRETLVQRQTEAQLQQDYAIRRAEQQVRASEMKLARLDAQRTGLKRQEEILHLARQQVDAAGRVLSQLESIAADDVTSEFVGKIEIDRQRVTVGEAGLQYEQKAEAHRQAVEDLDWAHRAAIEEQVAAQEALESAQQSQALKIIELELATLDKQVEASKVTAPTAGQIVAVNASVGEAVSHLPLVEMADTSDLVCEVEINEMDAALVKEGQKADIISRAFSGDTITGTVRHKYKLVGRPQLRQLDPLARADYRTVTAVIAIDKEHIQRVQDWLQLHVEVEIKVGQ
ncbi:MAG: efflux RND transporter periplasmic adaptor subunit [Planctomycetales bacterium]|nr:efflux RND transporter periplasmic adaptor subunit [Planctomycetales bacterium]